MTTEEILLTVLTIAIVVLISMVLAVLFLVLRIVKKINAAVDDVQRTMSKGSDIVHSLAPISLLSSVFKIVKAVKR